MAGNISPIFSKVGSIQGGAVLQTVTTADYTGIGTHNVFAFDADEVNGGFIQKLRFKAIGTNAVAVARIYINDGNLNLSSSHVTTVSGTPTGTPSTTGGTLLAGNYFARIQAIDQYGGIPSAGSIATMSTESASVAVTGTTGSIVWNWTAVTGAAKYRIFVGNITGGQYAFFESTTNSYTQTAPFITDGTDLKVGSIADYFTNQMLIGELSLPATTASTTAATVDIDYTLNLVLPPNHRILVGLGATVAAGWVVTGIGGSY